VAVFRRSTCGWPPQRPLIPLGPFLRCVVYTHTQHTHTHTHINTHTHTPTHTRTHTDTHTHTYTCYVHIPVLIDRCMRMHVQMCLYLHNVSFQYICIYMHINVYIELYIYTDIHINVYVHDKFSVQAETLPK